MSAYLSLDFLGIYLVRSVDKGTESNTGTRAEGDESPNEERDGGEENHDGNMITDDGDHNGGKQSSNPDGTAAAALKDSMVICYLPISSISLCRSFCRWLADTSKDNMWNDVFTHGENPTLVVIPVLWYTLYAWSDALWCIYEYLDKLVSPQFFRNPCVNVVHSLQFQEEIVIKQTSVVRSHELHSIDNSLLNYRFLLGDFRKAVMFLQTIPAPWSESPSPSTYNHDAKIYCNMSGCRFQGNVIVASYNNMTGATIPTNAREGGQHRKDLERMRMEWDALISEINKLQDDVDMRRERIRNVMNMVRFQLVLQVIVSDG